MKKIIITAGLAFFISTAMQAQGGNFTIVKNNKGADLGYSPESGIKILTVNGKKFNNVMTSQNLTDEEVADVLTYVYNSWGNNKTVVTPAKVKAIRAKPAPKAQAVH